MRVTVTPRHRRAFRRAGIEFPAEGRVLDLAALTPEARAAIEAEAWLVITPVPAEAQAPAASEASPGDAADAEGEPATPTPRRQRRGEIAPAMKKTDLI